MIRVAVADDQPLVRAGFGTLVAHAPDLELVGEAANGEQAVALATETQPDVLLMDIRMPLLDGIEATRRVTADPRCEGVRVIILTTFDLDEYVYGALRAGASGFLLKDCTPEDLVAAIRVVAGGDALLAPSVTRRLIERFADGAAEGAAVARTDPSLLKLLTDREREVLGLVARGMSNAEIGERIHVSHATAKTHVGRILTKLAARDRAQLVVVAYETGLVTPGG
ncbi:MAG TPA: response regulator transcription factor [Acidimicrobiales bacterium]